MIGNGYPEFGTVAMFQLDVAAGRMMNEETGPLKRGYDLARFEDRKRRA